MNLRHSLKCWLWKILWVLGAASLVLGVWGAYQGVFVLGFDPLVWYWNALILVALSIPVKLDCHDCGVCMSKPM